MTGSVRLDPVRCAAHGICAHVLGERIELDVWGFPIVDSAPLDTQRLVRKAKRAARACPKRALAIEAIRP
jgi:ferredoxin